MEAIRGRAWVFGDDVNTDVIHPPEYYSLDEDKVRSGLFAKLDPTLQPRLQPGDVLVGGRNFGCGSSRETSIRSIVLNRVGAVVAVDFARIFFRNATNNGLPCLELAHPADLERIEAGATVEVELDGWTLRTGDGDPIPLKPAGPFVRRIWDAGGLLALLP